MPFALVAIGVLLIVSAIRNTAGQLAQQLAGDLSGKNNFLFWLAGLGAVGALGYIPALRTFSRVLLALIILVMALSNNGFFTKFEAAIAGATNPGPTGIDPTGKTSPPNPPAPTPLSPRDQATKDFNQWFSGLTGIPNPFGFDFSGGVAGDIGSIFGHSGEGGSGLELPGGP